MFNITFLQFRKIGVSAVWGQLMYSRQITSKLEVPPYILFNSVFVFCVDLYSIK
jgi:hypothetical protein